MLIDNLITRFPNGLTNRSPGEVFSSLPMPDPPRRHTFFEDFDVYTAADWTVTVTGTGTQAVANLDGGRILTTNSAGVNDSVYTQLANESFLFKVGYKAFFRCLFQVSDAVQSIVVAGLQITDTTPAAVTDGVYFLKADGAATIDFISTKNSTAVTASAIASMTSATDIELAFYWDGISRIWYSVDGTVLGYIDPGTSLPDDEVLTVSFGIENGEAVAKTMTTDYMFAAMER